MNIPMSVTIFLSIAGMSQKQVIKQYKSYAETPMRIPLIIFVTVILAFNNFKNILSMLSTVLYARCHHLPIINQLVQKVEQRLDNMEEKFEEKKRNMMSNVSKRGMDMMLGGITGNSDKKSEGSGLMDMLSGGGDKDAPDLGGLMSMFGGQNKDAPDLGGLMGMFNNTPSSPPRSRKTDTVSSKQKELMKRMLGKEDDLKIKVYDSDDSLDLSDDEDDKNITHPPKSKPNVTKSNINKEMYKKTTSKAPISRSNMKRQHMTKKNEIDLKNLTYIL
jgi:hypothetical protein